MTLQAIHMLIGWWSCTPDSFSRDFCKVGSFDFGTFYAPICALIPALDRVQASRPRLSEALYSNGFCDDVSPQETEISLL